MKYLEECKNLANISNCKFVHFGCVIEDVDGNVIGTGFNKALIPSLCCLKDRLSNRVVGRNPGVCSGMHAEQMAIAESLRRDTLYGKSLVNATLYVAGWYPDGTPFSKEDGHSFACTLCARWIKYVGIGKVVTVNRTYTADEALQSAIDDILEKIEK